MLQQREVMDVFITFRFTDPKTQKVLKDITDNVCDGIDLYELGKLYAEKLKPYMKENIAVEMKAESVCGIHKFKVIRKNAGALIIEGV